MHLEKFYPSTVKQLRDAGCVFAEEEAQLLISASRSFSELTSMVDKRVIGSPIEHVIGWTEFCGLRIEVENGVFVPRRRTEFLVNQAISLAKSGSVVVDLCCGSGALGVALTSSLDQFELHATDMDPIAVQCAERNVTPIGGYVYEGNLFDPLPTTLLNRVDILMVNAPYVPTDAIEFLPPEAREYETRMALDGGLDGLDIHRRVAATAPLWLSSGGHLLVETSESQGLQMVGIFTRFGLTPQVIRSEELDATIVIGTKP